MERNDVVVLRLGPAAAGPVAPVDLRPEAGAETSLCRELDPALLRECTRQRRARDEAALHEDGTQQTAASGLLRKRRRKLVLGDEALSTSSSPRGRQTLSADSTGTSIGRNA